MEKDPRVITPMPPALLRAIDDFRFSRRLASRSEAIRQLIALGLAAAQQKEQA
jgi:metal-responsive CopG/Arc/MetJ family transcriptional regulator